MRIVLSSLTVLCGLALAGCSRGPATATSAPAGADTNTANRPGVLAVSDVVTLEGTPPLPSTNTPRVGAFTNRPPQADPLNWDSERKVVDVKSNEVSAHFEFFVTNVSSAEIVISDVNSSCGCTAAKLPSMPYKLAPGTFTRLEVILDLMGRAGTVIRAVNVTTSVGLRTLTIQANAPFVAPNPLGERLLNQHIAKADRQSVFRGQCAKCHLEPAQGRKGEALFTSTCGVCHLSKDRAKAVPDLATIKVQTGPDYWRLWITFGKHGTMMPAWGQEQGGPLSAEQIQSLVDYLTPRYPVRTAQK